MEDIINDEGVQSYSIQQNSLDMSSMQDEEIKKQQDQYKLGAGKTKSKVQNDDGKQSLLAPEAQASEFVDANLLVSGEERTHRSSARVTPRDLLKAKTPSGKTPTNAMKQTKIQKFDTQIKKQLISRVEEEKEMMAREMKTMRERDEVDFKAKNKKAAKNVIYPQYKMDDRLKVEREFAPPPKSMFIPLGFDNVPGEKKKHYRRYHPDELENIEEVMPVKTPFHVFTIKKGQSRGASTGLFAGLFGGAGKTDASGAPTTEQEMGNFKGVITV